MIPVSLRVLRPFGVLLLAYAYLFSQVAAGGDGRLFLIYKKMNPVVFVAEESESVRVL